jgi:PAS domain S-box-containing protein
LTPADQPPQSHPLPGAGEGEGATTRVSDRAFEILIQAVVDYAIYMLDPEGRVATWNPGAQRIKGYTPAEIVGQPFSNFYIEEDRAAGAPERALKLAREQGKFEGEGWRLRKDGSRFWAMVVIDPIWAENGELLGYAKVTRDFSERREAERKLEETREALFQSRKMDAVGQLTAGIAHDFNNLLAGIIGSMQLVRRRIESGRTEGIEKYLDAATASANRAAALTARLLAFGRRQYLDLKPVNVNEVALSLEDLLARTLGENIKIALDLDPETPLAQTDRNQLENAILNLVINARDAMPNGGTVTITTAREAVTYGEHAGAYAVLRVIDTGHGMTPEIMEKAIDPFFTTKAIGEGAGLGLSMIYGFANQTGGFLKLDSEPDKGTNAAIYMQISAEAAPESDSNATTTERGAGETVLLVEDDETVRLLVTELLSELGYETIEAGNAQAAIPVLESPRRIDLLITDIGLPGGTNGRQLAEIARRRRDTMPILMITGYAGATAGSSMLGPGMDLIAKPFQLDALAAKIKSMVKGAR